MVTAQTTCPECKELVNVGDASGLIAGHVATIDGKRRACPGSGQYPTRDDTPDGTRYANNSAFASCPACSGDNQTCPSYPDRAHRCKEPRNHSAGMFGPRHTCLCGRMFVIITVGMEQ